MPSSASTRLRLELQAAGENLNTWGAPKLNEALKRIEESIADWQSLTITGNKTLTSSNYVADEARAAMLSLEGTPASAFTITIPAVEKWYLVRNDTGQTATIKTSGGTGVTVANGVITAVLCDATDCYKLAIDAAASDFSVGNDLTVANDASVTGDATVGGALDVTGNATVGGTLDVTGAVSGDGYDAGGSRVTNVGTPTAGSDAATRDYVIAAGLSSALPGQSGNAGKFVTTDGSNASWAFPIPAQSSATAGALLVGSSANGSESWEYDIPTEAAITTNTTLTARFEPYLVDTSGGQVTLTLPASPSANDVVKVNTGASASSNKITFARNGETIMALSEDMECEVDNITVVLRYSGTDWRVTLG